MAGASGSARPAHRKAKAKGSTCVAFQGSKSPAIQGPAGISPMTAVLPAVSRAPPAGPSNGSSAASPVSRQRPSAEGALRQPGPGRHAHRRAALSGESLIRNSASPPRSKASAKPAGPSQSGRSGPSPMLMSGTPSYSASSVRAAPAGGRQPTARRGPTSRSLPLASAASVAAPGSRQSIMPPESSDSRVASCMRYRFSGSTRRGHPVDGVWMQGLARRHAGGPPGP